MTQFFPVPFAQCCACTVKRVLLTVQGLDGTVLLLPVRLQQSAVENTAEVTCRLQHDAISQNYSASGSSKAHVQTCKTFQITFVHPTQSFPERRAFRTVIYEMPHFQSPWQNVPAAEQVAVKHMLVGNNALVLQHDEQQFLVFCPC